MGITLITDTVATNATGWLAAAPSGLEYANFFSGSTVMSRNLADGKPGASVIGAPTQGTEYIQTVGLTSYIQTAAVPTNEFTMLAVAAPIDDAQNLITGVISNYSGAAASAQSLQYSPQTLGDGLLNMRLQTMVYNGSSYTADVLSTTNSAALNVPEAFSGRMTTGLVKTLNRLTDGLLATATQAASYTVDVARPLRIGSTYQSVLGCRVYAAFIWSRALTDPELAAMYAQVKGYYAARSITI